MKTIIKLNLLLFACMLTVSSCNKISLENIHKNESTLVSSIKQIGTNGVKDDSGKEQIEYTNFTFEYDDNNRIVKITKHYADDFISVTDIDYNVPDKICMKRTDTYEGELSQIVSMFYELDENGNVISGTDNDGYTETFKYLNGYLTTYTHAYKDFSTNTEFKYTDDGLLYTLKDSESIEDYYTFTPAQSYANKVSNKTNIDLNFFKIRFPDSGCAEDLYALRLCGKGSKYVIEKNWGWKYEGGTRPDFIYREPGITVHEIGYEPVYKEDDNIMKFEIGKNGCISTGYIEFPYTLYKNEWKVVVGNNRFDPYDPNCPYEYEIVDKNKIPYLESMDKSQLEIMYVK